MADEVLLVDPARDRTTYAGFARLVEGAAATLRERGLQPGDRVAVLARNGLEAAVAIWACARGGLVHVGLPVDAPPARVAALLELTGAGLLLASPTCSRRPARWRLPVADAAEVLLGREEPWRAGSPLPDQDTTYSLIPTSGTTGQPKAVRVTGRMTGHAAALRPHARPDAGRPHGDPPAVRLGVRARHAADAGDAPAAPPSRWPPSPLRRWCRWRPSTR